MGVGKNFTLRKPKIPRITRRVARLLSCFGIRTDAAGSDKQGPSSHRKGQATKAGTRDVIPERDGSGPSASEMAEEILMEVREVPWTALEARILLYRSLVHQDDPTTPPMSFKNFKAYDACHERQEKPTCVYVTPTRYFLKKSGNAGRGEFLVVPELPETLQQDLIGCMSKEGYDASFTVCQLQKGLRDSIDVPCLLVKW